jgi:flagellar hook-associated protein 3 FlgL
MTLSPLQLARVPDLLSSMAASTQINGTQQQLLTVEQQISTGKQFTQPSDNPGATSITMQLQRTLDQRTTYSTNLASAQSQLGLVDNSLSSLESLVQQAQNIASTDVNSDVSPGQRQADAQIIDSIYNQALGIANTQSNGLYLFGGDKNTTPPYVAANGGVQFVGSTQTLQTAVDTNTTVPFMVNPADAFGAASSQVQGSVDLTPNLTAQTRLTDLRGATGAGVQPGSIQISNGSTSQIIDLSKADTIGDVVNAINSAAVGGITAAISGKGLTLSGGATDNITVADVGGDTTADDLGIVQTTPPGAGTPVAGASVQANVTVFTQLSDLNGGAGIDTTGITINNGTLNANLSFAADTTVGDLLNTINGSKTGVQAQIDPSGAGIDIVNPTQGLPMTISENGGTSAADLGIQSFSAQTPLSDLNGGRGITLAASGPDINITASDGTSFSISLAGATTVQDVIDSINAATGGAVTAGFSATANGIELDDTTGGAGTFAVSNAGGSTAASDLGLTDNPASGNTITGSDVNPITAAGLFTNLGNLRDALLSGNAAGITAAAGGLQTDYQNIVQSRGSAGAAVQEMQNRQDQITTENTATQSLMSQLSDTDFASAITTFQQLQTSLQATLETTARTLNLSLIDYLS